MSISIVIPSFNRRELLRLTLDSLLSGTERPGEIIVVDDGSTDGTAAFLAATYGADVRAMSQPNFGPGVARNVGAKLASGDHLMFVDSDDLVLPWAIETVTAELRRHPWIDLLLHVPIWARLTDPQPALERAPPQLVPSLSVAAILETGVYTGAGCIIVRRSAFLEVSGFWSERVGWEDYDLLFRLPSTCRGALLQAPVTYIRRLHAEGLAVDLKSAEAGARAVVGRHLSGDYDRDPTLAKARERHIVRALDHYVGDAYRRGEPRAALVFGTLSLSARGLRPRTVRGGLAAVQLFFAATQPIARLRRRIGSLRRALLSQT